MPATPTLDQADAPSRRPVARAVQTRTVSAWASKALVGLLVLAGAGAHSEIIELKLAPGEAFERSLSIEPKRFVEVCGALKVGEVIEWQFEAAQALDFNLHYHVGKAVEYPEKRPAQRQAQGRFEPRLDQDYCWMWVNKGSAPSLLKLRLHRTAIEMAK